MADQEPLGRGYLLHEEIGRGAVAVVRRATSREGGPPLAAKLLRPEFAADRRVRELFLREEAALRDLDHPSVAALRDLIVEGGTLALVMEYVDGPNLRRYLSQRGGRLDPAEATAITAQAATALAAAHAQGIVHLDLKPENVLVARGSTPPAVRITDFGVAVLLHDADRGAVGGTPGYTAPEIFTGAAPTATADVWSLGVLLVEMITGNPRGNPEELPAPLNAVARDCLATDPRYRPPARRVAAYLRQLAAVAIPRPAEAPRPAAPAAPDSPPPLTSAHGVGAAYPGSPAQRPAAYPGSPAQGPAAYPGSPAQSPAAYPGSPAQGPAAYPGSPVPASPGAGGAAPPGRPPGDLAHWAGQLPEGGPRETRLRPGVTPRTPPPAAPDEPAKARWRRGPLLTLGAAALVAAVLAGLNMTALAGERQPQALRQVSLPPAVTPQTGNAAPPASLPATTKLGAAEDLRVTLAGEVEDDAGTMAVSIRDGRAIAYVCDGERVEEWMQGTARDGKLSMKGKDGSRASGTFDARQAEGEVTVEGETHDFRLGTVHKPSGLYRLASRVRGAEVNGGWIVLPDGRQVGVLTEDGVPGPAPRLDVASRTTTVDGTSLTATTIDVDSGEGF